MFKEYVCEYKHLFYRNGQSMEDCCYDVPGVVYGNARHQTRLCCNNMVEGKQAGSQGNGTGKFGVLLQVQTLVYFKGPEFDILERFLDVQNC